MHRVRPVRLASPIASAPKPMPYSYRIAGSRMNGSRSDLNGAPFFDPIPVDAPSEARAAGLAYRFRPEADAIFVQDRWIEDEWKPFRSQRSAFFRSDSRRCTE